MSGKELRCSQPTLVSLQMLFPFLVHDAFVLHAIVCITVKIIICFRTYHYWILDSTVIFTSALANVRIGACNIFS